MDVESQEAEWTLNRVKPKKDPPKYIIFKLLENKDKDKIWKIGKNHKLNGSGILRNLREGRTRGTTQDLKEKDSQHAILYPAKISFRIKGEIKAFSHEGKQRICH